MDELDVATADLVEAVAALLQAIADDDSSGLVPRTTLRAADEARVTLDRTRRLLLAKARRGEPSP